jgi:hypothetical protein
VDRLGELPSPTKKESGEAEAAVEERSGGNSHLLGRRSFISLMAAGGLSLLAPLERRGLEAAEIPKGATWIEGIRILGKGAKLDNGETHYTYYLDKQNHREKWIFGKKGELRKVQYLLSDIEGAVNREIESAPTQSIKNGIFHLHDLSSAVDNGDLTKEEARNIKAGKGSISFPPSDLDIDSWKAKNLETLAKRFAERGITVDYCTGVIDLAGIWYYRRANEQELPDYYEQRKRRREIRFAWEDTVSPALRRLDSATLDHR